MQHNSPLRRVVWWLALAVFAACAVWIGFYLYHLHAGARSLTALAGEVSALRDAAAPMEAGETLAPGASAAAAPDDAEAADALLLAEYRALARRNPDLAGWIHIEGTAVDYPVMHTPQAPEKYLHRDFEGRYSFAGLPFLDALCDPDEDSANQILYAHNMRSGQMFAALKQYLDADFFDAHRSVRFDTLRALRSYEVFAVLKIRATRRRDANMLCYQPFSALDEDQVAAFNAYLDEYAVVRAGDAEMGDALLTLSTCEHAGSSDRLVIVARSAANG